MQKTFNECEFDFVATKSLHVLLCLFKQGFHDFVFKYYMEEGRRGKLLSSLMASHPQLGRLLNTEGNEYLSWLHHIGTNTMWKVNLYK